MSALKGLEDKLAEAFKGFPQLPKNAKEGLVNFFPWLALIFGVLQLVAAWSLWGLTRISSRWLDVTNDYYKAVTGRDYGIGLSSTDKMIIYIGLIVLVVDAVILLMAYPHLKTRARRGWELLFLGSVINVVYSVVTIFIDGRGIGSFLLSLIGSAVGFYLLYQVRDYYGKKATATNDSSVNAPKSEPDKK
ncbi:hypothetical protein DYH10_03615 [Candidatus Saccharibacteria bacterium CPR2]|nr:hypothetical protein [Candidatus Saccharibacteria bacterium CPR2]